MSKKIDNDKKSNKFIEMFSGESLTKYYSAIEKPESVKKIKIGTAIAVILFIALAVVIPKPEEYAISLEKLPFFYSVLGFLTCVGIVVISKTIGHFLLERDEDYYDN